MTKQTHYFTPKSRGFWNTKILLQEGLVIFLLMMALKSTHAQSITSESRLLAECEMIYSYVAQLMQLQNNTGAAVAIFRRAAMLTTANMMSNAENEKIPGWKAKAWVELRSPIKANLDSRVKDPLTEAERCDRDAIPIALKIRDRGLRLWGLDFDQLQLQFLNKLRTVSGI